MCFDLGHNVCMGDLALAVSEEIFELNDPSVEFGVADNQAEASLERIRAPQHGLEGSSAPFDQRLDAVRAELSSHDKCGDGRSLAKGCNKYRKALVGCQRRLGEK